MCSRNRNNFAPLDDTWTRASSLNSSNFDPYPELENKANCYATNPTSSNPMQENYSGCYGGCNYQRGNMSPQPMVPMQNSVGVINESYVQDPHCCGPTPYSKLDKTWGVQPRYTL